MMKNIFANKHIRNFAIGFVGAALIYFILKLI